MQKNTKNMSFARRDRLLEIEEQARAIWNSEKTYEREIDTSKPKYMITFPYPYMNGKLHLGHAFSMSKAEFMSRYKTLKGYNTLFPQGYHCTGMPISAAAKKLKEELDTHGIEKLQVIKQEREEAVKQGKVYSLPMTQYEILLNCQVDAEEVNEFVDPLYWLDYFPKRAQKDLQIFGTSIDHRRSFITTSKNPYYNSFIEWQFNNLKEKGVIKFGKRPSIFAPKDNQMCADHDRAEGEGVGLTEYTLIKIEVKDEKKKDIFGTEERVFLTAATLRPETMYGQTNCFVLPEGTYGLYRMHNDELWVCSHASARNMAYQYLTKEFGKPELVREIKGEQMIGLACKAPLTSYETIYVWPMLSISMKKGTGVVTSVPSDSPDDYAVLVDLQKKKPLREKYGLTDEQVMNYKPISIINVPGYSEMSAETAYQNFKIKSMNDKQKLLDAKAEVYLKGFYKGIMKVGEHTGKTVEEAKNLIKKQMIDNGEGAQYYEPESQVISRSGDECVVALCDQWYIEYGQEQHKEILKKYVVSGKFENFNETLNKCYEDALDWLGEWGCSRSFGLGTALPWDKQYVIESLSDSTIYMAYYTVAHLLQKDLNGEVPGELEIKPEDLTHDDWNYIFLKKEYKSESKISEEKLQKLRASFEYWYPFDLRCSGKDLIKNHLTMSLYNHLYIWGEDYLPRGIFCNGWIMVDGEKMSKSKGNFFTLEEFCLKHSTDASRLSLAFAGDSVENANINIADVNSYILRLSQLENVIQDISSFYSTMRKESKSETEYFDSLFENEIKNIISICDQSYNKLVLRNVVIQGFFKMLSIKEEYKLSTGNLGMRQDLVKFWLHSLLIILSPIIPHFTEIMWRDHYQKLMTEEEKKNTPELLVNNLFPEIKEEDIDVLILKKNDYLNKAGSNLRSAYEKFKSKNKKEIKKIYIVCTDEYQPWQVQVLEALRKVKSEGLDWKEELKNLFSDNKQVMKKAMGFANFKLQEFEELGADALADKAEFSEFELLTQNLERVCKGVIDLSQVEIIQAKNTQDCPCKNVQNSKDNTLPRKPLIIIDFQ